MVKRKMKILRPSMSLRYLRGDIEIIQTPMKLSLLEEIERKHLEALN